MKEKLIAFCKSINIECVGIAPAEPFHDFEQIWKKQIEKGFVSGFEEADINKRVYPELSLKGAKSFIVCLFPYYSGQAPDANLSKSAYSRDYHIIVKNKLELIGKYLESNIEGFKYKAFVDTGPFSDRYLAYRAGLGFFGINNSLINDRYGSYFFIGSLLNNYPFEADKPLNKTCLQCFACVKNCPGRCILGDFTINPLKCRSYISQKKGDLSGEEKEILKKQPMIYGCDVCQDVCPHNREVKKTIIEEFTQDLIYRLDYEELKQMSNKEFMKKYHDRAFAWRGKAVLTRNHDIINGS